MNARTFVLLVAVALPLASSAVATAAPTPAPSPDAPPKFPATSDVFRKFVDTLITRMHRLCDSDCDAKGRSAMAGVESKVRSRTMDACRDGTVTEAEAMWVLEPIEEVDK